MEEIKAGDIVVLKNGQSPKMMVTRVSMEVADVCWFEHQISFREESIQVVVLMKVGN
jgi:uncharacterized protein YodC (DUF2158 family)